MIDGYCCTHIDKYKKEEWPTVFVAVPREGDFVKSKRGVILKVYVVTHTTNKNYKNMPIIKVELG